MRDMSATAVRHVDVLGVHVSAVDMDQTLDILDRWITEGHREYVCVSGVHGVMESRRDEALRTIHNRAGLVTPDGMPLVWWSQWCGARRTQLSRARLSRRTCPHRLWHKAP